MPSAINARTFFPLSSVLSGAALLLASNGAEGQDAHAQRNTTPPSPQSMAGDYFDIPQSAQLKVPLGPPPGPNKQGTHRPTEPEHGIGLKLAAIAAQVAEQSCARDGYAVTVAVADAAGNLKAALAADGTRDNGIYMAMHKTATVVGFKMSTLELRGKIEKDPGLITRVTPDMSLLPGGVPIFKEGRFLGAIATSGASAYEEEKCARDGIAAVLPKL
jgi:uncharacterized protein GlcG (DUF336 family)